MVYSHLMKAQAKTKLIILINLYYAFPDLGGARDTAPRPKFLHFHAVFGKKIIK